MDGVADGSLVRLVWNEGLKVAGDGALALVRSAGVGCHSCAFRKTLPIRAPSMETQMSVPVLMSPKLI